MKKYISIVGSMALVFAMSGCGGSSNGIDGTNGAAGTNGTNGAAGTNGTNGAAGTNGTNGAAGTNGQDLTAPTNLTLSKVGSYETNTEGGSEISAFDATTKKIFTTNGALNKIDVIDASNPQALSLIRDINLSTYGASVQSVSVKNGKLAIAVGQTNNITTKGRVVVLNTSDYAEQLNVEVGYLPDMVTFNEDGTKIVVANEGEPIGAKIGDYNTTGMRKVTTVGTSGDYVDVAGSVGVIAVAGGAYVDINFTSATLRTATDTTPVRLGGTPSNDKTFDLEPEYITVQGNSAYVTLQENNAVAKINLSTNVVEFVRSLGSKDYETQNTIDIEEEGVIGLRNYKGLKSLYMPDTISSYNFGGATYLVTANEGDGREYPTDDVASGPDTGDVLTDDDDIKDLTLDESIAAYYVDDNDLKVMLDMGETTLGSGTYNKLYAFGGRSFSIWDASGKLVWDSGDSISKTVAAFEPTLFNQDDRARIDRRSGNKGAEPEALALGEIEGKTYAFVGLERQSAIVIYDISSPFDAKFVNYVETHTQNDVSPEGMVFVPAASSANGKNLLIVSYEVSGSTVVYEIQ